MAFLYVLLILTYFTNKLNAEGQLCGRPLGTNFHLHEARIVAGYDVGYYRYPWFATLEQFNNVICGGALIAPKVVISAAHCYKEYIIKPKIENAKLEDIYNVTLGIYNKCEKEKTQRSYKVKQVYIHEKYKDNLPYFDISLLILAEDTSNYSPICLPKGAIKVKPKDGTVPGLGTLRYHGSTPCTLHEARILIQSDEECRQMINSTGNDPNKLVNAFCAGYIHGGIDTCQGDSGGPLQILDENGNFVILGIVSFGFRCANPGLLGIYTDVSQYVDWIETKTELKFSKQTNETIEEPNEIFANKPHRKPHLRPFYRPIRIVILRGNRLVVVKKNILQYPIEIIGG